VSFPVDARGRLGVACSIERHDEDQEPVREIEIRVAEGSRAMAA
jgi:hypothetical protein